jgi:hypothetical protein
MNPQWHNGCPETLQCGFQQRGLSGRVFVARAESTAFVELMLNEIADCLERGETVELALFGPFWCARGDRGSDAISERASATQSPRDGRSSLSRRPSHFLPSFASRTDQEMVGLFRTFECCDMAKSVAICGSETSSYVAGSWTSSRKLKKFPRGANA